MWVTAFVEDCLAIPNHRPFSKVAGVFIGRAEWHGRAPMRWAHRPDSFGRILNNEEAKTIPIYIH